MKNQRKNCCLGNIHIYIHTLYLYTVRHQLQDNYLKNKLRSNSLRSTERKLFYPSIPVIMRHTRNMVGYASGSKCSLIFYITLVFVCLFFTISNKERVYSLTSHFFFFPFFFSFFFLFFFFFFFFCNK